MFSNSSILLLSDTNYIIHISIYSLKVTIGVL